MQKLVKVTFKKRGLCPKCGDHKLSTVMQTVIRISYKGKKLFDIVLTSEVQKPECCHCALMGNER